MRQTIPAYAIVRHSQWSADPAGAIDVVAVVPTREEAEDEVQRLKRLNAGNPCRFFWTQTRYRSTSRSVSVDG